MSIKDSTVTVKKLAGLFSTGQRKIFIREIRKCIDIDRPRIVLDCSNLHKLEKSTVYFLLCCLEEAMKNNGDVKLAALSVNTSDGSNISGINRLFDIYNTTEEAVNGFHQFHESTLFIEPTLSVSYIEMESTR